jgi:hypothetical protein
MTLGRGRYFRPHHRLSDDGLKGLAVAGRVRCFREGNIFFIRKVERSRGGGPGQEIDVDEFLEQFNGYCVPDSFPHAGDRILDLCQDDEDETYIITPYSASGRSYTRLLARLDRLATDLKNRRGEGGDELAAPFRRRGGKRSRRLTEAARARRKRGELA